VKESEIEDLKELIDELSTELTAAEDRIQTVLESKEELEVQLATQTKTIKTLQQQLTTAQRSENKVNQNWHERAIQLERQIQIQQQNFEQAMKRRESQLRTEMNVHLERERQEQATKDEEFQLKLSHMQKQVDQLQNRKVNLKALNHKLLIQVQSLERERLEWLLPTHRKSPQKFH
jgi:chromosome segregation ATPase